MENKKEDRLNESITQRLTMPLLLLPPGGTKKQSSAPSSVDEDEKQIVIRIKSEVTKSKNKKKEMLGSICYAMKVLCLFGLLVLIIKRLLAHQKRIALICPVATWTNLNFVDLIVGCTNDNDGTFSGLTYHASGGCFALDFSLSASDGCSSGIFQVYNSPNCTGPVVQEVPRDTCSTMNSRKLLLRCSTYTDAEYLRASQYQIKPDGNLCEGGNPVVTFFRLDFCYAQTRMGNGKYRKINATTFHESSFADTECVSEVGGRDVNADGVCRWNRRLEIVRASVLSNL